MKSVLRGTIEWLVCIISAVVIALFVRYYICTPTIVKQTSMFPTLKENDRLWLSRWERTIKKMPERGDIITFEAPSLRIASKIDKDNPVAEYNYEFKNNFEKFVYYVLETGKSSYIKRVVALPGEFVQIKNGAVYIDGKKLEEDYLPKGMVTDQVEGLQIGEFYTDFVVPENTVFALGDNRTGSTDCRAFGCIPLEKIEGKVLFRFWPFSTFGRID